MRELNVAPIQYLEDLEDLDNMYKSYIVAPLHRVSIVDPAQRFISVLRDGRWCQFRV